MFPDLNPKKMQALMKQMGLSQEELEAKRVIIEQEDKKIILENPTIMKMKIQGQTTFQITGEPSEKSDEASEAGEESESNEETDDEKFERDVEVIVEKTGVSKDEAAIELEKNNGDIAETIIKLSKSKKQCATTP